MSKTKLTENLLKQKGFKEETKETTTGRKQCFIKDNIVVVFDRGIWIPCCYPNMLCTEECVDTWEELERLINEGNK